MTMFLVIVEATYSIASMVRATAIHSSYVTLFKSGKDIS